MLETKLALDQEMARLTKLAEHMRVLEPLTFDEQELLEDLVSRHAAATEEAWLAGRIEAVVDVLYPAYDRRGRAEEDKPVRWPEKDWWWNGASVDSWEKRSNGDFVVDLTSYVGCGESDDIRGLVLPKEWVYADDVKSVVLEACRAERERRAAKKRDEDLAAAQREANAAVARLAKLQGVHHG